MQVVLVGFLEKVIYGLELEGETLPVWHLKETCLKDKTPEIKGWSLPNVFKMYVYSAIREQEAEENFTGLGYGKDYISCGSFQSTLEILALILSEL